ncbi:MAG: cytochrome c-type biogenesis protein CcmH [Myxococcaceae bacterium]|nr:cytochrome c-type biogenesis protein CcmH [Myxococcaceae bacterium]
MIGRRGWRAPLVAVVLAGSAALAAWAPQKAGTEPLPPELEARVQALGKQIRCAVCQGMSIADSPASMARAQLDMVRTMVKEGRSDEEIKAFFVERYGEFALLKPSTEGVNRLVWVVPVLVFLFGLGFAVYYVIQHKPKAEASAAQEAASEDPYVNALRSEIDR